MPLTRRQTYRRRRLVVVGTVALVLAVLGYLAGTGLAPVPAAAAAVSQPAALTQPAAQLVWPGVGEGALGAVGYPGLLGTGGGQGAVPIASVTKMVTSLVILDKKPLVGDAAGPDIGFTDKDVQIYYQVVAQNGSVAPVVAGMVLTQRQAFEAMLLPSANNYSISLAIWAFGSVEAYLAAATAWLADRGLNATAVADTSGLSPGSRSSPADLVEIGKLAIANPALASIVALQTANLPTIGTVTNTNRLLGTHGVTGIKTGTTDEAGAVLLFSVEFPVGGRTITLVGVLLGGATHPELDAAVTTLIESAKPGFREVSLTGAGRGYGSYATPWGQKSRAVATKSASAVVWSDTPITATVTARAVALGNRADAVGSIDFTVGDRTVSVPLALDRALSDPGPGWRFTHPGQLAAAS